MNFSKKPLAIEMNIISVFVRAHVTNPISVLVCEPLKHVSMSTIGNIDEAMNGFFNDEVYAGNEDTLTHRRPFMSVILGVSHLF